MALGGRRVCNGSLAQHKLYAEDLRKVDKCRNLSLPRREAVVEVVVNCDGVDEDGKLGHAPAEHERGD